MITDVRALPGARVVTLAEGQGYFPVLVATPTGAVIGVLRGGAAHFGVRGRLDLVTSTDGETFSAPRSIVDSDWDDRNPALGVAADGTLILAYHRQGSYRDDGSWDRSLRRAETCLTRSRDGGQTWDPPRIISAGVPPGCSPYGRMVRPIAGGADDPETLLLPLYGYAAPGSDLVESWLVRSRDGGATFSTPTLVARGYSESAFVELPGGDLVGALRATDDGSLAVARSDDGGRSFTSPARITRPNEHPGDLVVLADGRLLLVFGQRNPPCGVAARLSDDGGRTFGEALVVWAESPTQDCGYPSAVRLPDGRILIAFYEVHGSVAHRNGPVEGCAARVVCFDERALPSR